MPAPATPSAPETPPAPPPERPPGWPSARRIVGGIILLVLAALYYLGITAESFGIGVMMCLLAGIGVIAGLVAAGRRKKGNTAAAFLGYPIACWCLFLAFFTALRYHAVKDREDFFRRLHEDQHKMERLQEGAR